MSSFDPVRQPEEVFDIESEPGLGLGPDVVFRHCRSRIDSIDRHVGSRIRSRRIGLGMTQQALGNQVGVTYQQLQKYERGTNRIAAGVLFRIAQALAIDVRHFFEGAERADSMTPATSRERMQLELTRHVLAMPCQQHREAVCELARTLAEGERHRLAHAAPAGTRK